MYEGNIRAFLYGVFAGFAIFCLCQRFCLGGIDGSEEFDQAISDGKQRYAEHHKVASEGVSRAANYNQQLKAGQSELDYCLREAERRIDNAIKKYEKEIERK